MTSGVSSAIHAGADTGAKMINAGRKGGRGFSFPFRGKVGMGVGVGLRYTIQTHPHPSPPLEREGVTTAIAKSA